MRRRQWLIGAGRVSAAACAALCALPGGAAAAAAAPEWVEAEVRRIDREGQRLTLKHGPIRSLDMPAMTMAFRVREPALLERLEVGDRVRVQVLREGGQFMVVALQRAS